MTDRTDDSDDSCVSRRTFMKGVGVAATAASLGTGVPTAAAEESFDPAFANWRVREARKAWDRGVRGRADRTLAFTDSGIDARHPDVGPWNGFQAVQNDDVIELTKPDENTYPETERTDGIAGGSFSGQIGPGGPDSADEVPTSRQTHEFTVPDPEADDSPIDEAVDEVDAELSWTTNTQDNELYLEKDTDDGWERIAQSRNFGGPESVTAAVETDGRYRFVVESYVNGVAQYEITYSYARITVVAEGDVSYDYTKSDVFAAVPDDPSNVDETTPKVLGWYDPSESYRRPRDTGTHGTNGASVAAGTGRAIAVDTDRYTEEEPRAVLIPGDTVEYEVSARADTSVFASAYGENIELTIEGPDGRELAESGLISEPGLLDSVVADTPTVHESGEATYTVYVTPLDAEGVGTGRLTRIAVGASLRDDESDGDRTAEDGTLHAGLAPNAGLVGMAGLGDPTLDLAEYADQFADLFNVRAVNMSWSYISPAGLGLFTPPYSATGVEFVSPGPSDIKQIAEAGILPVAAAGNSFTAGQESTPALADEAIAAVATDALDGIVTYSSSGLVANDEDGEGTYKKPDVTAPGGDLGEQFDYIRAAQAGDPDQSEAEQGGIRDYYWTAGTSFSSPYVAGASMLVAEAMEFEAPETIALPEPAAADLDDVMRLKQAILATASETAYTAAPYHDRSTGKAPRYDFGGHDIYEGWGRVNPEVAVDAVSRDLLPGAAALEDEASTGAGYQETVGLNVPEDQRAFGGHVNVRGGTLDVSVDFSHYAGGNKGMTKGDPHVDLFVYDAENPAQNGEPNIVASAQGLEGNASTSLDVDTAGAGGEPVERTFYVVAKLVNVPGVVNGYDVQAYFDFGLEFEAGEIPDVTTEFTASGSRSDDGRAFTGGATNTVQVTIEDFENAAEVSVTDQVPDGWTAYEDGDVESFDEADGVVEFEGTVEAAAVEGEDDSVTFTYFAEAPSGASETGSYTFGPATAEVVTPDVPEEDTDGELDGDAEDSFGGTDTNYVAGADQSEPTSSTAGDATSTASDAGSSATESATDGATDTVSETADGVNDSL